MSIVLVGSSSGSITLQEPAVAGTTTLNLPATSGTVVVTGTTPTLNGITFPATQVPSANANTLDDYEEGTFTPNYGGSGSNPTVTYNRRNGRYVKIGQFVQVTIEIQTDSVSGGSGSLQVTGLPFTSLDDRYTGNGVVGYADSFTSQAPRAGYVAINATDIWLTFANTTISQEPNTVANLTNGTQKNYLLFTATYRASA
jgi:hypothetical protein